MVHSSTRHNHREARVGQEVRVDPGEGPVLLGDRCNCSSVSEVEGPGCKNDYHCCHKLRPEEGSAL